MPNNIQHAHNIIEGTLRFDDPANNHYLNVLDGLVSMQMGDNDSAQAAFRKTLTLTNALLIQSPNYFRAKYTQALAFAGLGLLAVEAEQDMLLSQSRKIYQEAIMNCSVKGIKDQALKLLEEFERFDKKGLVPQIKNLISGQSI